MASSPFSIRPFLLVATLLIATGLANAQTQQVYRYTDTDGSVVYSDKPPPANAKDAQAKRITKNSIETSDVSFSVQQAQERFPVTLFTFSCGVICDTAEGTLNKRGIPHSVVDVSQGNGAERLKKLTGGLDAPALQVGEQTALGFNDSKWQSMLTDAGYPLTPAPRTNPVGRAPAVPAVGAATTQSVNVTDPPKSGGYPQ